MNKDCAKFFATLYVIILVALIGIVGSLLILDSIEDFLMNSEKSFLQNVSDLINFSAGVFMWIINIKFIVWIRKNKIITTMFNKINRFIKNIDLFGKKKVLSNYRYLLREIARENRTKVLALEQLQKCDEFFTNYLINLYRGKYIKIDNEDSIFYVMDIHSLNGEFLFRLKDDKNRDVYIGRSIKNLLDDNKMMITIVNSK